MQINYLPPSIFGPFVEYWRYWLMPVILTLVTFVTVVSTIIVCSDFYENLNHVVFYSLGWPLLWWRP